jgi:hypothetical protein
LSFALATCYLRRWSGAVPHGREGGRHCARGLHELRVVPCTLDMPDASMPKSGMVVLPRMTQPAHAPVRPAARRRRSSARQKPPPLAVRHRKRLHGGPDRREGNQGRGRAIPLPPRATPAKSEGSLARRVGGSSWVVQPWLFANRAGTRGIARRRRWSRRRSCLRGGRPLDSTHGRRDAPAIERPGRQAGVTVTRPRNVAHGSERALPCGTLDPIGARSVNRGPGQRRAGI